MKWKRKYLSTGPALMGGDDQYKVVKYGDKWFAFFRPKGWESFGNSCRLQNNGKSCEYGSMRQAISDAEYHAREFEEPLMFDRLP